MATKKIRKKTQKKIPAAPVVKRGPGAPPKPVEERLRNRCVTYLTDGQVDAVAKYASHMGLTESIALRSLVLLGLAEGGYL